MAITDLESRKKEPDTTIGEVDGDHNGDTEILRTPERQITGSDTAI